MPINPIPIRLLGAFCPKTDTGNISGNVANAAPAHAAPRRKLRRFVFIFFYCFMKYDEFSSCFTAMSKTFDRNMKRVKTKMKNDSLKIGEDPCKLADKMFLKIRSGETAPNKR
jgi:hypothetical protein